jgi:hypothetical protein
MDSLSVLDVPLNVWIEQSSPMPLVSSARAGASMSAMTGATPTVTFPRLI